MSKHANKFNYAEEEKTVKAKGPITKRLLLKTPGIKVFTIIDKGDNVLIDNNYSMASTKYIKIARQFEHKQEKYTLVPFKLNILYWYKRNYEGVIAVTEISQNVWYSMIRLRGDIKKYTDKEAGDVIIYWKRGFNMVWYAWLTQEYYEELKPHLQTLELHKEFDVKRLKEAIFWTGSKAMFSLKRFRQFYGGMLGGKIK